MFGVEGESVIDRLIEFSLRNRFLVVAFYLGIAGWGYWVLTQSPVDAIPDLSDNQVIVFTDWSGRSPQEVPRGTPKTGHTWTPENRPTR